MFILYYKMPNNACVTWRGKQIAMCEDRAELEKFANSLFYKDDYYIEEQPERVAV